MKTQKQKKKVPGWSIEELKERPDISVEEDTEEVKRWRSLNQNETGLCWKNLAERMEEEVLDKYKGKGAFKGRGDPLEWRRVCRNKRKIKLESGGKLAGKELSLCLENTICSVCYASMRS